MLLAFDAGNSDITIGLYDGNAWRNIWRIPTHEIQPEIFYAVRINEYFLEVNVSAAEVKEIVISSVVPDLTPKLQRVANRVFEKDPLILGPALYQKLPIKVLNPYEIGSDLVANAMAGFTLFNKACVVIDFGTALTFTVISNAGEILGVAIAPGLKTAIKSLSQNTAKLFEVPLQMPSSVLGKGTVHAIQAGIFFSYEGAVKNVLDQIKREVSGDIATVATGGLSSIIPSIRQIVDVIEPNLTLNGLYEISKISQR